jgi:hypothetical protein
MATKEGEDQEDNVEGEDLTKSGLELKRLLNRAESVEVRRPWCAYLVQSRLETSEAPASIHEG